MRCSRRSGFPSGRLNMYHTLLVKGLCEDGRRHTPAEQQDAERRIQQLIENANAAQKSRKEKSEDFNRSKRMLKMLPDAFVYTYGDRQGDRVQLYFKPNPRFRTHGFEEEVF